MKLFLNEKFILFLIVINSILLFFDSFESRVSFGLISHSVIHFIDVVISVLFVLEMIVKIYNEKSFYNYIDDNWNKLDFCINLLIIPSIVLYCYNKDSDLFMLSILRLVRIAKFFRFFKFIPNIQKITSGLKRALKSSVFVIFSLSLYLFIMSIISCFLFKNILPEYFADPIVSFYSTFKVFTIEGWYDIPDKISEVSTPAFAFFTKMYFIFLVLSGGICGLSLINAIFVDEMVSDNNDELLKKIEELNQKIDKLSEKN